MTESENYQRTKLREGIPSSLQEFFFTDGELAALEGRPELHSEEALQKVRARGSSSDIFAIPRLARLPDGRVVDSYPFITEVLGFMVIADTWPWEPNFHLYATEEPKDSDYIYADYDYGRKKDLVYPDADLPDFSNPVARYRGKRLGASLALEPLNPDQKRHLQSYLRIFEHPDVNLDEIYPSSGGSISPS